MRKNLVKEKLSRGEIPIGITIGFYSPFMVELCGALGFDWAFIDCEHGSMDPTEVENMVRAAELFDITPITRTEENSPSAILRHLDRGVQGIIVPHVATAEEAKAAVHAAKFHPLGERSTAGGGRTNNFGIGRSVPQFYEDSNSEIMVFALIESAEGIENIEDIASVPGLDGIWIGPNDLGQSMGMPSREEVDVAVDRIIEAAHAAGKPVGTGAVSADDYEKHRRFINKGANMVLTTVPDFMKSCGEFMEKIQAMNPSK